MFMRTPKMSDLIRLVYRTYICINIGLIASIASFGQTPVPTPSPAPTPITKTGSILVNSPSTVGRISKWVASSTNGIGTIGDSVIEESSIGTLGIGTNPFSDFKVGVNGGANFGGLYGSTTGNRIGVFGQSNSGNGVRGFSSTSVGVFGQSNSSSGVHGFSNTSTGVTGQSNSGAGMWGISTSGNGVIGQSTNGIGTYGQSQNHFGLYGFSQNNYGIYAQSGTSFAGYFSGPVNVTGRLSTGGLLLNSASFITFADGTTQSSAATITGVTAGTGLTGGGTAGTVTLNIASGGVDTTQLRDSSVTSAKLVSAAVGSSQLADSSVISAKIADGAVSDTKIAAGSIKTSHLASEFQISQSQVTNLTADLASKAADSGVVHIAGDESITGTKTFGGTQIFNNVNASQLLFPEGTISSGNNTLTMRGSPSGAGATGGFLSFMRPGLYYPGGSVMLSAGATSPDYNSTAGPYISLTGNDFASGGNIMIASGHAYGNGGDPGGTITLNASGAYGGGYPPPGYLSFQIEGNETMRVANTRNVGIGTSNPQSKLHVSNSGGSAGLFDGNVTVNGNLTVTGTTTLSSSITHDSTLSGNGTGASPLSVVSAPNGVVTTGSYANPSWITSLDGTKIAGNLNVNQVTATGVNLPSGTIKATAGSPLVVQGAMGNGGSTGGYLSLDPGGFYYPGGGVKLSAGATAPDYNSTPGAFITLDGNSYQTGGDILIASGHAYGANTGGAITLNTNGAYAGNNPSPGYISLKIQGNESLRVASNGNVGIGTSTPQAKLQVANNGGNAGQFDGNVTVNGNLTVTGTTNLSGTVAHDSTLAGNGTAASPLSVVSAPNGVVTTGSYANPSWITSLDGNKLTSGTVVKSVNGLTDNVTLAAGDNVTITPSGNTLTISANAATTPTALNPNQVALMRWYPANKSGVTFTTGTGPSGIVFDGSSIWIANGTDNTVTKLRPGDGQVLGTFATGANPGWMAFDGANIWIAHFATGMVSKLRASDGQVLATIPVGRGPVGIAFDGENVWVSAYQDWNVVKLRASDGAVLGSVGVQDPFGLAFDGTNIWVSNNRGSGGVTKIAATGPVSVLGVCGTGQSFTANVAFDGSNIWTVNSGGNSVTKLRPSDCGNLGIYSTGYDTVGITFDGANIWVPTQDALYKLRASDGVLLATVPMSANRGSAAFDGANVWVTHPFVNIVTKH
jgi:hypothetical protein